MSYHPLQTFKHLCNRFQSLRDDQKRIAFDIAEITKAYEARKSTLESDLAEIKKCRKRLKAEAKALIPQLEGFKLTQKSCEELAQ